MSTLTTIRRAATAWCLGLLLAGAGCVVSIDPIDGRDGGDDPTETQLTIRIVNATSRTIDPEIYLSNQGVSVSQLFTGSRKFTTFGVGRQGLIASRDTESFTVDCADARVLGTLGGIFGGGDDGNDLVNPDGNGRQIVLTQDLNVFCGGTVTFRYSSSRSGFTTTFDVDP